MCIYFQELYHELHALDRFDQDYRRKNQDEENSTPAPRGTTTTYVHFFNETNKNTLHKSCLNLYYVSIELCVGDSLQILKQELKSQKKHVKGLKKRSLWSKNLEEVGIYF